MRTHLFSGVAMALTVASAVGAQPADEATLRCQALRGMAVPAEAIGLPTSGADISSAQLATDGESVFCLALGAIDPVDPEAPDINVQIACPSIGTEAPCTTAAAGTTAASSRVWSR